MAADRARDHRDRRSGQRDKPGMQLPRRIHHVRNQLFVVSHHSLQLGKAGNKDETVHVVPPWLVVRVIGRVAARRVVHDRHAAELKKRRAHAGDIGGVG